MKMLKSDRSFVLKNKDGKINHGNWISITNILQENVKDLRKLKSPNEFLHSSGALASTTSFYLFDNPAFKESQGFKVADANLFFINADYFKETVNAEFTEVFAEKDIINAELIDFMDKGLSDSSELKQYSMEEFVGVLKDNNLESVIDALGIKNKATSKLKV